MQYAVVYALDGRDSTLLVSTRVLENGRFDLRLPSKISATTPAILLVGFPGYADFTRTLPDLQKDTVDIGTIYMFTKEHILNEVVVSQKISAIRFVKDTIEYKADSFLVHKHSSVEDLLKQFPGIQVDQYGKITAQGKTVQRVLVDGEEYFGLDPTLVTHTLRSDLIDKVQVYDAKTDQAAFSGIDDGIRVKTINLRIKRHKRNTYFGKLSAGVSDRQYHSEDAMYNQFNEAGKFAAYIMNSTTGKQALTWQEQDRYGDASASSIFINDDLMDAWNGSYENRGYPQALNAGIHYNTKLKRDNQSISGTYRYGDVQVKGTNKTITRYQTPAGNIFGTSTQTFANEINRNRFNTAMDLELDSFQSMKITLNYGQFNKKTLNHFLNETKKETSLLNTGERRFSTSNINKTVSTTLLWRTRFRKKGRTMSANFSWLVSENNADGFLKANYIYHELPGMPMDSVDQYKNNKNDSWKWGGKLVYSEPLSATMILGLSYSFDVSKYTASSRTLYKEPSGSYTILDSTLSNEYRLNVISNNIGATWSLATRKTKVSAGAEMGVADYDQKNLSDVNRLYRKFFNFFPKASIGLALPKGKSLTMSYNGSTQHPPLSQIQPLVVNTDPLNLVIGNPNLKPSFDNEFNITYLHTSPLDGRNWWLNFAYFIKNNARSTNETIDAAGKRSLQFVNIGDLHTLTAYGQHDFQLKKLGIRVSVSNTTNFYNNENILNGVINKFNAVSNKSGIALTKTIPNRFEFDFRYLFTASWFKAVTTQAENTNFLTHSIRPTVEIFLPGKWQFHSDLTADITQAVGGQIEPVNIILWNTWIGKRILKNESITVRITVNDILNENQYLLRNINSNYFYQTTSDVIQRYFMIGATWNFTKKPKKQ